MSKKLLSPSDLHAWLVKRYNNQHQAWLAGEGSWPLEVGLGMPQETEVLKQHADVRTWVSQWRAHSTYGTLVWESRRFARAGDHDFPARLVFDNAEQVAGAVGQLRRWRLAGQRYARMTSRWPQLAGTSALTGRFDALADYSIEDFERLYSLLGWLDANPGSGLYLRQLPVEGLDTKWFEQRKGVVTPILRVLRGVAADVDFYALCGLKRPAHRLRMRVVCPQLQAQVGGLEDVEAPLQQVASMALRPRAVIVVENLETGLAIPGMPGVVVFMRLGNAVSALGQIPWLAHVPVVYWGDIDTYGFAILSRARQALPQVQSVLMDEATLLTHRSLWSHEASQCPDTPFACLTEQEASLYQLLRAQALGPGVRLEQERIDLGQALAALVAAVGLQ